MGNVHGNESKTVNEKVGDKGEIQHKKSREPLRATSFAKKEKVGIHDAQQSSNKNVSGNNADSEEQEEEDKVVALYIQQLEADVQRLNEKCSALESQNILVAVQQLDIFTRHFSLGLSIVTFYAYWKLSMWHLFPFLLHSLSIWIKQVPDMTSMVNGEVLEAILESAWTSRFIKGILLFIPYLYNRWTHGSIYRRFQVFVVAFVVMARIRMCRWREQMFLQDDSNNNGVQKFGESCTNDGIWEANYEISARYLYLSVLRLRGLWTKSAQYLSSRADFMPLGYIRELSKLQDQAPSTPWEVVEKMLPSKLLDQLTEIEKKPIASASIGQVHIARLKATGEKVVVKVQHPHARTLLTDDFWSLKVITRIIGWMEPEYAFMEILMREWAVEARKELDFMYEAQHMKEAHEALQSLCPSKDSVVYSNVDRIPFQVQIPCPMMEFSNRDTLVMNYCEGCRIDDFAQIEKWGLSREAVMDGVAQAFAHFMYCSTIFNGDPHPGNLLVRPGIATDASKGFTIVLLDWGLSKRLPEMKRVAFCQMVYAAATLDYGLLLDSFKTVGLNMKREDAGQSMEDMRFFLRDMAPRDVARKTIKLKLKKGQARAKQFNEKVPMHSRAYPGEFFFFVRVNELLHGLGSRFGVNLGYLDALAPYAERGLRMSSFYDVQLPPSDPIIAQDEDLQKKLQAVLRDLEQENNLVGGQVCIIDKAGVIQADIATGNLGGLRNHIAMPADALILGFSTTKAIAATLAHVMVDMGYLSYDEPICERVWKNFCPFEQPPPGLDRQLNLSPEEVAQRWQWKREITLRHILSHSAGLWDAFPAKLTIKRMACCEECFPAFEYNPKEPGETILPTSQPSNDKQQYHFMSFGWLMAGTLCNAYSVKHNESSPVTFEQLYETVLVPKLSTDTRTTGFYPMGGGAPQHILAHTVTSDVKITEMMQKQRIRKLEGEDSIELPSELSSVMKTFKGKEFLLDPRIWNSRDALTANVPAAGGRFSARGLAHFYHDLATEKILIGTILNEIATSHVVETPVSSLQGVTQFSNDTYGDGSNSCMSLGYQLFRTDLDRKDFYSCLGHAGIGGSIGFIHRPTGLSVAVMLNKADGGENVTMRILRTISEHYKI